MAIVSVGAGAAPAAPDVDALQRQATQAFERDDFDSARAALLQVLDAKPNQPAVLYNLACAHAQLGERRAAEERLVEAISYGFVDFFHMDRDPHLAPIRAGERYQSILLGWRELLDARADATESATKRALRGRYIYERDPALRLITVSAFDEQTTREGRDEIDTIARWAFDLLFTDAGFDDGADLTPDPWVTVILPTPEDFMRMVRQSNIGGFYDHDRRRLISQDIGPSFRHEFLHVLHWRDMTRRNQKHPDWIMEGLCSLVEDLDLTSDGEIVPAPSWRTNISKRLERGGRLLPLETLMTMPRKRFVGTRPSAHYAQARTFMLFLDEIGELGDWYADYVEGFVEDDSGVRALERTLGKSLDEIEQDYRAWLRELPEAPEQIRPGMASLGVVISPGRGDGPAIQEIERGSDARRAGLRAGDVIVAIDGRSTRTMEDLVRLLSERSAGEMVDVSVRRGSRRLTMAVRLSTMR